MPTSLDGDTEGLIVEHTSIEVEIGERCPLLLCRAKEHAATALRPVFVMHGTGQSLDGLLLNGHLQRFARRGMLASPTGTTKAKTARKFGLDSEHYAVHG